MLSLFGGYPHNQKPWFINSRLTLAQYDGTGFSTYDGIEWEHLTWNTTIQMIPKPSWKLGKADQTNIYWMGRTHNIHQKPRNFPSILSPLLRPSAAEHDVPSWCRRVALHIR